MSVNVPFPKVKDVTSYAPLSVEIAKKALSAAAALSDRSEASPAYMLWTVPTTLLSILGLFYFVSKYLRKKWPQNLGQGIEILSKQSVSNMRVIRNHFTSGAIGIIGYQLAFSGGGSSLGPTIVALTIPAAIAVVFVLVRSSVRGDINVKRVLKARTQYLCFRTI